jgi:hypothetical protein
MQAPIRSSHGCWDLPDLSQKPLHTVKKNRDCRQPPGPTVAARNPSADIKTRSFPLPPLRCWPRNIITFSFPGKKQGGEHRRMGRETVGAGIVVPVSWNSSPVQAFIPLSLLTTKTAVALRQVPCSVGSMVGSCGKQVFRREPAWPTLNHPVRHPLRNRLASILFSRITMGTLSLELANLVARW